MEDDIELLEVFGMVVPQHKNPSIKTASTAGEVSSVHPQK
jgi:hypothetical protein